MIPDSQYYREKAITGAKKATDRDLDVVKERFDAVSELGFFSTSFSELQFNTPVEKIKEILDEGGYQTRLSKSYNNVRLLTVAWR